MGSRNAPIPILMILATVGCRSVGDQPDDPIPRSASDLPTKGNFSGWVVQDSKENLYLVIGSHGFLVRADLASRFKRWIGKPVRVAGRVDFGTQRIVAENGRILTIRSSMPQVLVEVRDIRDLSDRRGPFEIGIRSPNVDEAGVLRFKVRILNLSDSELALHSTDLYLVVIDEDKGLVVRGNSLHGEPGNVFNIFVPGKRAVEQEAAFRLFRPEREIRKRRYRMVLSYGNLNVDNWVPCAAGEGVTMDVEWSDGPAPRDGSVERSPGGGAQEDR
ncbi:MAG: hypothetical protein JXP34_23500 [Planctomycetes bacterium]|nr:hypothetical protein [Planctomycetota bacterium]